MTKTNQRENIKVAPADCKQGDYSYKDPRQ